MENPLSEESESQHDSGHPYDSYEGEPLPLPICQLTSSDDDSAIDSDDSTDKFLLRPPVSPEIDGMRQTDVVKKDLLFHIGVKLQRCGLDVAFYEVFEDPADNRQLWIFGVDVTKQQDMLDILFAKSKYAELKMKIKAFDNTSFNDLAVWRSKAEGISEVEKPKMDRAGFLLEKRSFKDQMITWTTCELIVTGRDKTRARLTVDEYYGVVPAHFILTNIPREYLTGDQVTSEELQRVVAADSMSTSYCVRKSATDEVADVVASPLVTYHSRVKDESKEWHEHFLQDMALVKIDTHQLTDYGWDHRNKVIQFSGASAMPCEYVIDGVVEIRSKSDLQALGGQKIFVKATSGTVLVQHDISNVQQWKQGLRVSFILKDESRELNSGDAGSIVYLVSENTNTVSILGMLIGKTEGSVAIYQATLIEAAIVNLQYKMPRRIGNVTMPNYCMTSAIREQERHQLEHKDLPASGTGAKLTLMTNPLIPPKLHLEIKRFVRSKGIQSFQFHHDPINSNRIVINGEQVEQIEDEMNRLLQADPTFGKFSVTTINTSFEKGDSPCPLLSNWIRQLLVQMPCGLKENETSGVISTIEFILEGIDEGRQRKCTDYYGVTTGHSLMDEKQREDLRCSGQKFSDIWEEIANKSWKKRPFINVPNGKPIDIVCRPLLLYRYLYRTDQHDDGFILNDIVIFKLDRSQLQDDGWLSADSIQCQHGPVVNKKCYGIREEILAIDSYEDLNRSVGRKVICKGRAGVIVPKPDGEIDGWSLGLYIAFIFDNIEDGLEAGDCGSVLYLVDDNAVGQCSLGMIGMFIGTYKPDETIHQAIILSQAIKKIEEAEDQFRVTNLKLLNSVECLVTDSDSGPAQRGASGGVGVGWGRSGSGIKLAHHK